VDTWLERQLTDLAWHWGSAFVLSVSPDGARWTAIPAADRSVTLRAGSATELRAAIRKCYDDMKATRQESNAAAPRQSALCDQG
jgi:hypothetical protein